MSDMANTSNADSAPDFSAAEDPFALFQTWMTEAEKSEPNDPNAMSLATVDAAGLPNVRMVLLKGVDDASSAERGFVFYTNFESAKGRELLANPKAALLFHWKTLERQIRVRGAVSLASHAEADAYYAIASAAEPHRRLGFAAVAAAVLARCARSQDSALRGEVLRWPDSAAILLVGVPHRSHRDRILDEPAFPPARQDRLSPRRAAQFLAQDTSLSLSRL